MPRLITADHPLVDNVMSVGRKDLLVGRRRRRRHRVVLPLLRLGLPAFPLDVVGTQRR